MVCRPPECWQMHCYTEMQKLYLYFCMYPAKLQNIQISPCYSVPARSSHLLGFPAAFGLISHVHMYFRLLNFIMQSIMHCSSNKWESSSILLPKRFVKSSFKFLRKPKNSCWNMVHASLLLILKSTETYSIDLSVFSWVPDVNSCLLRNICI